MTEDGTGDTFTCGHCGGTFEKSRPDEAANAEARDRFGVDRTQDPTMAIVCDDCYTQLLALRPPTRETQPYANARIVAAMNQKYGTTLSVEIVEVAVRLGFTSWEALLLDAALDV